MVDDITEANFRAMASWDAPKPPPPESVPGLPALNALRLLRWRERETAYRLAKAERYRSGVP